MPGNKQHMFAANHEALFALVTLAATPQHHPAAGWKTPLVKKPGDAVSQRWRHSYCDSVAGGPI